MLFFNKGFLLKVLIIIFLLFLYLVISAVSYANIVSFSISDSVLRLHVVANSNSNEDQTLKLKVRDAILQYMNMYSSNFESREEAISFAQSHLADFYKIAQDTIVLEGFNYDVSINIENCYFPTKVYGDVSLPEGYYDAINIKIGTSQGNNWWCVMFPPLCFVDVSSGIVPEESKEILKNNLGDDEYEIITSDTDSVSEPSLKFKIVELVEKFSQNWNIAL